MTSSVYRPTQWTIPTGWAYISYMTILKWLAIVCTGEYDPMIVISESDLVSLEVRVFGSQTKGSGFET